MEEGSQQILKNFTLQNGQDIQPSVAGIFYGLFSTWEDHGNIAKSLEFLWLS